LSGILITIIFFSLFVLLSIRIRRKNIQAVKVWIFFICWFVIGISLHLQIIPLEVIVAKRWLYVPIAGIFGAIGFYLNTFALTPKKNIYIIVFGILLILLCMRQTLDLNQRGNNDISLNFFSRTLKTPRKTVAFPATTCYA
jgi:hypothetical protein